MPASRSFPHSQAQSTVMQPYPHTYTAAARAEPTGLVSTESPGLDVLHTAPPTQFDGPGDRWSPETLLIASIADCFVLTFRAVSRTARFQWVHIECRVDGVLDRVDGVLQFARYTTLAVLTVANGADVTLARKLLEKAEQGCLIANSLRGARALEVEIRSSDDLSSSTAR
jgi:organic hydroperoxide reductase OsmC/OhrA